MWGRFGRWWGRPGSSGLGSPTTTHFDSDTIEIGRDIDID